MGIQFKQVNFSYTGMQKGYYEAIKDINLKIESKGEFITLVGQTGSGKSTLAQHMNALVFPTSGSLEIFGKKVTAKRDRHIKYNDIRQKVGLVFQFPEYQLFEETVEKDIMFGPLNFHKTEEEAKALAKKALQMVGLSDHYLNRNPFNLSGGEKKRVSIAGILALDPQVLVLDEPTSGLDPKGKRQLMDLFKSIQEETGKTILVITHDMDLVYEYAKRVIVLDKGNLVFDGTPDVLFRMDDLSKFHLDYPQTIRVLKGINERFNTSIDVYQKTVHDATEAIKRGLNS